MKAEVNALRIHVNDNVVTALNDIAAGDKVVTAEGDSVVALTAVPTGHKLASCDIKIGLPVTKYGEVIANASKNITTGDHVHIHNVKREAV